MAPDDEIIPPDLMVEDKRAKTRKKESAWSTPCPALNKVLVVDVVDEIEAAQHEDILTIHFSIKWKGIKVEGSSQIGDMVFFKIYNNEMDFSTK